MNDIRIRQICLVTHDLDTIEQQLESVFQIEVAYRDPGVGKYGLHNMLMPIGNQLLETVSPKADEQDTPGGRYLKRRGGDGGIGRLGHPCDGSGQSAGQCGSGRLSHGGGYDKHLWHAPAAGVKSRFFLDGHGGLAEGFTLTLHNRA